MNDSEQKIEVRSVKDDNDKKSLAVVLSGNIKLIIVIISLITALITFFAAYSDLGGVPVQPPTPTPTPTPTITPPSVTVRGIVTDENKNTVDDATVSIDGQSSMTNNDGLCHT